MCFWTSVSVCIIVEVFFACSDVLDIHEGTKQRSHVRDMIVDASLSSPFSQSLYFTLQPPERKRYEV